MRVLVLTNHFANFAGSEVVALEVAQWFRAQGDDVMLAANYIAAPINAHAGGLALTTDIASLHLQAFDLVWCQHDLLTVISPLNFESAARSALPHVALVSLSPYELYEHVDAWFAKALSAEVFANSDETSAEQSRRSHGELLAARIRVFHNAAPARFWTRWPESRPETFRTLTLISNHAPNELNDALRTLEAAGVTVRRIGLEFERRLVSPDDFADTDAVITIGKSVSYAIASGRPVYMYDGFGGDGWLIKQNFARSMAYNFSGRPSQRRLASDSIVQELGEGFAQAANGMTELLGSVDSRLFVLDHHLTGLRERAAKSRPALRALNFRRHLLQSKFRAHLETLHAKSLIMRQSYLGSVGG